MMDKKQKELLLGWDYQLDRSAERSTSERIASAYGGASNEEEQEARAKKKTLSENEKTS